MILLLDNYDSFVFNLDRYLRQMGQKTWVVRSDAITVEAIEALACQAMIISPGPKTPDEAGCSLEVVRRLAGKLPILGICLGHQTIGQAMGGNVVRAPYPVHGRSSLIYHRQSRLLCDLPSPFPAGRYHSLVVEKETLPPCLQMTAWTEDGLVMAMEHREWPLFGLQFHPESILTRVGYEILGRFLTLANLPCPAAFPRFDYIDSLSSRSS